MNANDQLEALARYLCRLLQVRRQYSITRSEIHELLAPTAVEDADAVIAYALKQRWLEGRIELRLTYAGEIVTAATEGAQKKTRARAKRKGR